MSQGSNRSIVKDKSIIQEEVVLNLSQNKITSSPKQKSSDYGMQKRTNLT